MSELVVGRLLRSDTTGCTIGCRVEQAGSPAFGDLLRIPLDDGSQVFGLVYDIHIEDDGLVRQLVTSSEVSEEIIEDNRHNRNVPVEMSLVFIGWERDAGIRHTRVPRPPLTLDKIYACGAEDMLRFVTTGRFGYLRPLLRSQELPAADLLTAHLRQVLTAANDTFLDERIDSLLLEVIALLKDDYPQLMDVLSAISETLTDR